MPDPMSTLSLIVEDVEREAELARKYRWVAEKDVRMWVDRWETQRAQGKRDTPGRRRPALPDRAGCQSCDGRTLLFDVNRVFRQSTT
jgi:hypothetical protein